MLVFLSTVLRNPMQMLSAFYESSGLSRQVKGIGKNVSEWTNWADTEGGGKPEGVQRYVEWRSLFIAKTHLSKENTQMRVFFISSVIYKFARTLFAFIPAFLRSGLFLQPPFFITKGCFACQFFKGANKIGAILKPRRKTGFGNGCAVFKQFLRIGYARYGDIIVNGCTDILLK